MTLLLNRLRLKRLCAATIVASMLCQTALPALATVSQVPGLYVTPPRANLMFTLDDSGSMLSDAIPDYASADRSSSTSGKVPLPEDSSSSALSGYGAQFPSLWSSGSTYLSVTWYKKSNPSAVYLRSADGNPLYYNPKVTYTPWPLASDDKQLNAAADPTRVNIHAYYPWTTTRQINLKQRLPLAETHGDDENYNFWPATYFVYRNGVTSPLTVGKPQSLKSTDLSNFDKIEIKPYQTGTTTPSVYARGAERSDCSGPVGPSGCSYAEELQNFANWLQYYRSRMLMAKGGVSAAFAQQGTNLRVGFGTLNSSGTVRQGVATFEGTRRTDFYNDLYPRPNAGGTRLRQAANDVGQYFINGLAAASGRAASYPWSETPTNAPSASDYTCRRAFHVLSTDGFWNDNPLSGTTGGDQDTFSGRTPLKPGQTQGYAYSNSGSQQNDPLVGRFTIDPFKDTAHSNTLADIVAYYWKTDLRSSLANEVPSSLRDPAFWQHLTTYTVGLGVNGTGTVTALNSPVVPTNPTSLGYPELEQYVGKRWLELQVLRDWLVTNKIPVTWSAPTADAPETGDDLIHASMNGRGKYFSASDPSTLKTNLAQALAEAADNPGSLANVVTQSPQVSAGSLVFQATYNPSQWSGRFYAFPQATDGTVDTTPSNARWEASNKMPTPDNRNIFSWNPTASTGSTFTWAGLTTAQQTAVGSTTILNYLRGSSADETANGGALRDRARYTVGGVTGGVLGDIVNGSPIKGPSAGAGYERLATGTPGQSTYASYRSSTNTGLDNMRNTLFLGANDGMLHAFELNTGVERFAYVPNSVYSVPRSLTGTELKLKMLSDPGYTHRFTVDGPPQIADAYIGADAANLGWKTVLVSSTGTGSRGVFAMDVTDPNVSTAGFGTGKLMWEFSEANNADMGYVTGYPNVARMRDGTWVAIFGNGYDSTNGQAKLFIVNLQTGVVVWEQGVGAAGGNGLSQPNFVVNNNREVTAIYAGDIKGNLWKFDVDNTDRSQWKVAFGATPNYLPLFAGSATQPITVMPELSFHPNGGTMVSFGTGKLFEVEDTATSGNVNLNTQAIYGIWDKPAETVGFSGTSTLVQQSIDTSLTAAANTSLTGTTANSIDWATKRGWYLNLNLSGERVNVNPQQVNSVLLIVTNRPDTDPCKSGGSSRLFTLDPITGSVPSFAVFDANNVGGITSADKGYNVMTFSFGVLSLPTLQSKKPANDVIVTERAGSRGQTGARLGGVEKKPASAADCAQWLLAGGSNTTIAGVDISTCKAGTPRISWRQLK